MKSLSFLRTSPYAKTIYKYCHIFLAVDLVLICLIVYGWYIVCGYNLCTRLPRRSTTNILAFGDSMTRGFVKGSLYYPYSKSLEKTLNRIHSRDTIFVIDNGGLNGDTAIGLSRARLQVALSQKKYDWVILLFGTNDLYRYLRDNKVVPSSFVDEVLKNLKELCRVVLKGDRMLVLGTVTARQCEEDSFYAQVCDEFMKSRELLNKKIRSYVASSTETILLADFERRLNYRSFSKAKRLEYWQDNVHLTETGYEFMAKLVYKKMQPYLPEASRPDVARNITLKV